MSTYFIGDVHGCYDDLIALLERIRFNRDRDRLVFVGDLVNRGGQSIAVLRFIHSLGDRAQVVLGNHDISLIAYAYGLYHGRGTDFAEIMAVSDSTRLVEWLRQQPLLIEVSDNIIVTHAGIPPRWSLDKAIKQARKAEKKLRGEKIEKYLRCAYGGGNGGWHSAMDKYDKFRYRINGFSRMRYCDELGEPNYHDKCPIGQQAQGLAPWFTRRPQLQDDGQKRVVFGHWAALGYHVAPNAICLDSGCAWGGSLTAVSFEGNRIHRIQVQAQRKKRQILHKSV